MRVVALLIVLPLRLLWELIAAFGRILHAYLLTPLGWLFTRLVVEPVRWVWARLVVAPLVLVWRGLVWAFLRLVVEPVRWVWARLVVAPLVLVWRGLVWAFLHLVVEPLRWVLVALAATLRWLWSWLVVRPISWSFRVVLRPAALWLYRHVLVPIGQMIRLIGAGLEFLIVKPLTFAITLSGTAVRAAYRTAAAVLAACGRMIIDVLGFVWKIAGIIVRLLGRALYHATVRPVRWMWRTFVRPVIAAAGHVWRAFRVVTARTARWTRLNVARPVKDVTRSLLRAMGAGGP